MHTLSAPPSRVSGLLKAACVLSGYVIAFLAASVATAIRVAHTSGPDAQASSGMYAFGDGLLFLAVFGTVGVIPTGAFLFFLRPVRVFWSWTSVAGMIFAATAPAAS